MSGPLVTLFNALVLIGALASAMVAIRARKLIDSVIALGAVGAFISLEFILLSAPDVAIAEASVGAVLSSVLFIIALKKVNADQDDLRIKDVNKPRNADSNMIHPCVNGSPYSRSIEMFKDHLSVHFISRHTKHVQKRCIFGKPANQRTRGRIALKAAAIAARTQLPVKIDDIMTDLAADAPFPLYETSALDDTAADAGADRHDERISTALGSAVCLLAERRSIRVVDHRNRQTEFIFQDLSDLAAEPVSEMCSDTDHGSGAHIDLPGRGNADALGLRFAFFEDLLRK